MRWRPFDNWRRKRERDLDRELQSHLELETEEQQETGLDEDEAARIAQRALGNTTQIKEATRETWGWTSIETFMQDLRYALRMMRRSPGFTLTAVLSVAVGIGATTAVFSVLNAVVLRPLPVAEPGRLVFIEAQLRGKRYPLYNPLFESIRENQGSLEGMFAISDQPYLKVAIEGSAPVFLRGTMVSGNYFQVLGITPALGRVLASSDDDASSANCAAVISFSLWQDRFHGDAASLGRGIRVGARSCTIVGVAPAIFHGHEPGYPPDIWVPLRPMTDPKLLASHGMAFYSGVMGRLRRQITFAQAEAELTTLYQRIEAAEPLGDGPKAPKPSDFRISARPGAQGLYALRRQFSQPLMMVLTVAWVVLLIALVNVANLLLARGAARSAELATRAALGVSRARLIRQLTTEGAVLALSGGFLGVLLAWAGTPALAKLVSGNLDASPDQRVLAAAFGATILAALVAGILPALRLSRGGLQVTMASAGRSTGARSGQRLTRTLVVAQLASSLLLVTCASLLLRTIMHVMAVDPGFDASHVVQMDVRDTEPAAKYGEPDTPEQKAHRATVYRTLDERLNAVAGVRSASISWLGFFGGNYVGLNLYDADHPENRHFTLLDYVSPHYFETIGMRILRGRGFTEMDLEGTLPVAVVNEAFVRERITSGEALGRRFVMTYLTDSPAFTIIGIVRDSKYNDPREPKTEPMMWVPLAQMPNKIRSVSLRVQPGTDAVAVRQAEAALASTSQYLMVQKVTTLTAQVDHATFRERLLLGLASVFGGLALLLAAIGLYGTLAYAIARRTREIGVRLALGAQRTRVLRLVLGEALVLVAGGVLFGVPLSLGAGYSLRAFLFGVSYYDPLAMIAACAFLTIVAVVAAFVPAFRASRIDPMSALRCE
jgi:predicted permease